MALVCAAAWVAVTVAVVWKVHHGSQVDRQKQIAASADSIRARYIGVLDSLKADLAVLGHPDLADTEVASLKLLPPTKISGYDLGAQLYPDVLKALSEHPFQALEWLPKLKNIQTVVAPLKADKARLAEDIGAANEAALNVTVSGRAIFLAVLAFAISCSFMSFFGMHAQRFAELASLYRTLADKDLLFDDGDKQLATLRKSLVGRITRLETMKIDPSSAAKSLLESIPGFLKTFKD
jgi:hypothetical protein